MRQTTILLTVVIALALLGGLLTTLIAAGPIVHGATLEPSANHFDCDNQDTIPVTECQALEALYTALNFEDAGVAWTSACQSLVRCDEGHVTSLRFASKGLSGTIPSAIRDLVQLETIFISNNPNVRGFDEIHNLPALRELDAHDNNIGPFPPLLTKNTALETLNLTNAGVTGALPDTMGDLTALQTLLLRNNEISGTIPASMANLGELTLLNMAENQLTGPLPEGINGMEKVQIILLSENQLTGTIPAGIGALQSLGGLYLDNNDLEGAIPVELGNASAISILDLHDNQLQGPIPGALGNATSLTTIRLQNNLLSGTLPSELAQLSNLGTLQLGGNRALYGPIPSAFENLSNVSINTLATGYETTQLCYGGPDGVSAAWASAHIVSYQSLLECSSFSVSGFYHFDAESEPPINWEELVKPRIDEAPSVFANWGSDRLLVYGFDPLTGTYTIRPEADGYGFSPRSRTVTVPPVAQNVNFTVRRQAVPDTVELVGLGEGFSVCRAPESVSTLVYPAQVVPECPFEQLILGPGEIYTPTLPERLEIEDGGGVAVQARCIDVEETESLLDLLRLLRTDPNDKNETETLAFISAILINRICDSATVQAAASAAAQPPFVLSLREGAVEITVFEELEAVQVNTEAVTVVAGGGTTFSISHQPVFMETKLTAKVGNLELTPQNESLPPFTLEAGRQATVGEFSAGVDPILKGLYLPNVLR